MAQGVALAVHAEGVRPMQEPVEVFGDVGTNAKLVSPYPSIVDVLYGEHLREFSFVEYAVSTAKVERCALHGLVKEAVIEARVQRPTVSELFASCPVRHCTIALRGDRGWE